LRSKGQTFTALNGGPVFTFNEAISFQVLCETQDEIDYYWEKLSEGGDEKAQQYGWLKDKHGLSWQIVPEHPRLLRRHMVKNSQQMLLMSGIIDKIIGLHISVFFDTLR